jgi:membrane-bound inhibitor of C-type lysozyme
MPRMKAPPKRTAFASHQGDNRALGTALPARITAPFRALMIAFAGLALVSCDPIQKKKEEELAKSTFACSYNGERFVVRFSDGEARMLLPELQRVTLYQLPSTTGVRYSNGTMELRGKGTELQLIRDGVVTPLKDCEPYAIMPPAK